MLIRMHFASSRPVNSALVNWLPRSVLKISLATVAVTGRSPAGRFAFDGGFGPFLCGIEHALGDLDILQRQVALVGAQLFGFGAELIAPEFANEDLEEF
jgi:hypothetical protein